MKQTIVTITTLFALLLCWCGTSPASPFATEVVEYSLSSPNPLYNNPDAVLGKPTTLVANDPNWGLTGNTRVKMVEPAYNTDPAGNNVLTTVEIGDYIVVKFDHQVEDDPDNPYGIDFLVFGNSLYTGSGMVSDYTNMESYLLTGGGWFEEVTISVSQDGTNWYTYTNGPFADGGAFPTQAYQWDAVNNRWTDNEMDFTKPVDPALAGTLGGGGITAEDAIALYNGSGGGTGFDLAESGFEWIEYIKVTGAGGEVDAFSDVASLSSVPVPGSIALLATGLAGMVAVRRKNAS